MSSDDPDSLGDRIAKAKAARDAKTNAERPGDVKAGESAGALALRYGAEFGASVFVGILFGLGIDHLAGTRPWGLLVMLGLGLAAGTLNMVRAYREMNARAAANQNGPPGPENGTG
ncbi:MAG: AtpZ/AtpI family protein [Pseudomonadota bacterium]